MEDSSNNAITVNTLVKDQIDSVYPLFDEYTEYIFWGSLIHAISYNGVELVHELSNIPVATLCEYLDKFNSDIKNRNE